MPEYRAHIKRAEWGEDDWVADRQQTSITVHEENDPVDIGILDSKGNPIYRYPDTVAVGYFPKVKG